MDNLDTEITLPSVVSALQGRYQKQQLILTILFHPDTARIGERAIVPVQQGHTPWVLGRRSPAFGHLGSASEAPLDDPHISRRALQFTYRNQQLTIDRFKDASRCRLARAELTESIDLDSQQLRSGQPLMLGHSIVLMLRLCTVSGDKVLPYEGMEQLRGSSSAMQRVHEQIIAAAAGTMDVLIRGETGTGKELVATAIHRAGASASAAMVCVNMAAVPKDLAPSLLFGSARGAFTGANAATKGYFEQAAGGSLFLDEIGDTPPEVQPQLLRALQQREIQTVGGDIKKVELRVISATDAALEDEAGNFKAALRYRLGACEIVLPPLREHPEDLGELLLHFVSSSAAEAGRSALLPHTESKALDIAGWAGLFFQVSCYDWPGNIRELSNIAQQVVLASETSLSLGAVMQNLLAPSAADPRSQQLFPQARIRKMQEVNAAEFDAAMSGCGFEAAQVAKHLRVSRAAVYRRIEASEGYQLVSEIPELELQQQLTVHGGESAEVAKHFRVSLNGLRQRLRNLKLTWQ